MRSRPVRPIDQVSAHFFGEGDDDHHPYYLSAFLARAFETRDALKPEVESAHLSANSLSASDQGDAVAPVAVTLALAAVTETPPPLTPPPENPPPRTRPVLRS
jgi:hypothetical protein